MLSNIPQTKGAELITGLDHISEHAMMRVYFRIPPKTKRSLPYKAYEYHSKVDTRRALESKQVKEILKKDNSLSEPL